MGQRHVEDPARVRRGAASRRPGAPHCPFRSPGLLPLLGALLAMAAGLSTPAGAQAPGGIVESATSSGIRARVIPSLPARGPFTFPVPYNTRGARITNATDCGGADCVTHVGYSYWRNMNNHVGSDTMYIFLTLSHRRGGGGPTLFAYDKLTEQVRKIGPLFDASHALSWATGEGWYWSATRPTVLYVNQGAKLYRYDVLARALELVFDAATQFGADKYIWQIHSSQDDRVHSATLRRSSDSAVLGCLAYDGAARRFSYFEKRGSYDECQVDRSGRWLLIKDNVDGAAGEDNVIVDLWSGAQTVFRDQAGGAGHSDNGFGYMVAEDNWNAAPGAVRVWTFGQPFPSSQPGTAPQGTLVYRTTDWALDAGHVSHTNARAGVPPSQQYACSTNASRRSLPRANEILCFPLDGSLRVLVVAPTMSNLDAPGGGDDYAKRPKGNLDVTGEYFIWTSNVGGGRLDAFLVKVPAHRLGVPSPVAGPVGPKLTAATLPASRSIQVGGTATAFATIANLGDGTGEGCTVRADASLPLRFAFQTTDPTTNVPVGHPDEPVDIHPGGAQTFVVGVTPSAPMGPTNVNLTFSCANGAAAPIAADLNTLSVSASTTAVPDILALPATTTRDGIVNLTGSTAASAVAVATMNVGAAGLITATPELSNGSAPVGLTICQTEPGTSRCLAATGPSVTTLIGSGDTLTFGVFVERRGIVPFDPSAHRIAIRFRDEMGVVRGTTSVAVRTQ